MKYRHSFHAGNFADVHKHVTLLQLLTALKKKDKGFLYLDTHAGRGSYDLSSPSAEAAAGIGRFASLEPSAPELRRYAALLTHGLWQSRYGRDPGVLGRTINVDGRAAQIIGVLPPDFEMPNLAKVDLRSELV